MSQMVSKEGSAIPDAEAEGGGEILTMEEVERLHIIRALEATGGNRTKAAETLRINVRTLRNKIRQYKLDGEEVP